jgi:dipeptide/tripeptide permease
MTAVVGLPVNMIGIVFFFNTILIVGAQVWVLRRLEGRSRSRLLGVIAVLWAVCWLLFAGSAGVGAVPAAVVITIAIAVFAVGEMIWSPVGPSLVNDVAPPELRGRYNATMGLVWGVGGAIGPAYAGIVIGSGFGVVWAVTLAVGCLVGGLVLGSLRGLLSAAEDGREPREAVEAVRVGG